jgi:hypothetical protein
MIDLGQLDILSILIFFPLAGAIVLAFIPGRNEMAIKNGALLISAVTFVISLFDDDVGIYEIVNRGGWYDFGFILGLTMIWGGSGAASRRKKKKW